MNKYYLIPSALMLVALANCSGGGSSNPPAPAQATGLSYVDPGTGTYLLKQNAALSTASHLVLELWGPSGTSGSGVTASFTVDATKAAWSNVASTDAAGTYVANGTVFNLGTGTPIVKAKVSAGVLTATVAEKGVASPKALAGPLMRVALDFKTGAGITTGTAIALTPDTGKCQILLGDGTMPAITVSAGTLTAK